jgi:hypothetical protein
MVKNLFKYHLWTGIVRRNSEIVPGNLYAYCD